MKKKQKTKTLKNKTKQNNQFHTFSLFIKCELYRRSLL